MRMLYVVTVLVGTIMGDGGSGVLDGTTRGVNVGASVGLVGISVVGRSIGIWVAGAMGVSSGTWAAVGMLALMVDVGDGSLSSVSFTVATAISDGLSVMETAGEFSLLLSLSPRIRNSTTIAIMKPSAAPTAIPGLVGKLDWRRGVVIGTTGGGADTG
jgi:hypothetical protein